MGLELQISHRPRFSPFHPSFHDHPFLDLSTLTRARIIVPTPRYNTRRNSVGSKKGESFVIFNVMLNLDVGRYLNEIMYLNDDTIVKIIIFRVVHCIFIQNNFSSSIFIDHTLDIRSFERILASYFFFVSLQLFGDNDERNSF